MVKFVTNRIHQKEMSATDNTDPLFTKPRKVFRTYLKEWESIFKWVKFDQQTMRPICTVCNQLLVNQKNHLKRHEETKKHQEYFSQAKALHSVDDSISSTPVINKSRPRCDIKRNRTEESVDTDIDSDPVPVISTLVNKIQKVKRKYLKEWESTFKWVKFDKKTKRPICIVCNQLLANQKNHLKRHEETQKHKEYFNQVRALHSVGGDNVDDNDNHTLDLKSENENQSDTDTDLDTSNLISVLLSETPENAFLREWESTFKWVRFDQQSQRPICTVCNQLLANQINDLKRHEETKTHQENFIQSKAQARALHAVDVGIVSGTTAFKTTIRRYVTKRTCTEKPQLKNKNICQSDTDTELDTPNLMSDLLSETQKESLTYLREWESTFKWVKFHKKTQRPICTVCNQLLNNQMNELKRHEETKTHKENFIQSQARALHSIKIDICPTPAFKNTIRRHITKRIRKEVPQSTDSDTDSNTVPAISTSLSETQTVKRIYLREWESKFKWIKFDKQTKRPICSVCNQLLVNQIDHLKRHEESKKHQGCLNQSQFKKAAKNMSAKSIEIPVQTQKLLKLAKTTLVPKLTENKHKGQYGRIGVIGGSLEYTGAPFFSALSALKVGADLAHVFCQQAAAVVIKSYSPELIVHPVLDAENALEQIEPWLERLHVLVIGPGLGREPHIQKTAISLMALCQKLCKPLIIDADGLTILNEHIELISGHRNVILTPNAIEFRRLFSSDETELRKRMSCLGDGVIVLEKGAKDIIHIPNTGEAYTLPPGGSGRRCGGQGDLLCGSLATFLHWSLESNQSNPAFLAAFAASYLVKQCNAAAFAKHGRSMLASDMINEISPVFRSVFENNEQ